MPPEVTLGRLLQIGPRLDPQVVHRLGGDGPDAVDGLDRQVGNECLLLGGRHNREAVGLVLIRGDLGHELAGADACGGRESGFVTDLASNATGKESAGGRALLGIRDIEVGLIQRERFDQVRVPTQNVSDGL
jgi:hypothetical protein